MGGLSESVKEENLWQKYFFSDIFEWSSKNLWKMTPVDVKANKTKRNKRSGGFILQFFIRSTFKTWDTM